MNAPHPIEQPDDFRAWTLLYLERHLSLEEESAFADLLRESQEARRAFAEAAQFDAHLYELRSQETIVPSKGAPRHRPAEESRRAWVPAAIAAGILALIVLGAVLTRPQPHKPSPAPPEQANLESPVPAPAPEPQAGRPALSPKEDPRPLPEPLGRPEMPKAAVAPEPSPATHRSPPPPAEEKRTTRTIARLGRLERVQGQVQIVSGKARLEARSGMDLAPGQGVVTARESSVALVFGDGTRFDLAPETALRDVLESPQKQATLVQGTIAAEIAKQPPGAPMRLATPHADLTIVGTAFVVTAEAKATRLHVKEGQVRLARRKDGAVLDVQGGTAAAVADGVEFALRPMRPAVILKGRSYADLEALYLFSEGKGGVIEDVSGAGESLDLRIRDESAVRWLPRGLLVHSPTAIVSAGPAAKISEACRKSHELTVEAWFTPASAAQVGPARLLSLSAGPAARDFMLGQGEDKGPNPSRFTARLRTTATNENGMPGFMSDEGTVKVALTHLVVSRSRAGTATWIVDGAERGRSMVGGDFSKWKDYRLALADEPAPEGGQPWLGAYYLVAIYSRALGPDEILQHFKAGPLAPRVR